MGHELPMEHRKISAYEGITNIAFCECSCLRFMSLLLTMRPFITADPQIKSRAAMLAFRTMVESKKAVTFDSSFRRCRSCPSMIAGIDTATVSEIHRTQSDLELKIPEEVPQPVVCTTA